MGIPSYYRALCDSIPGLIHKVLPKSSTIRGLWIDFNCVIYHCIRRPGTPAYPGEEGRLAWEDTLLQIVCRYIETLVNECKPQNIVYMGVDGVVPMAKVRQQRKRRCKSAWLHKKEVSLGKPDGERWDTNAITPGTAFMERLSVALKRLAAAKSKETGVKWIVSGAEEPGEGEQKLFHAMQNEACAKSGEHVIYGLDADLIVMSLYQVYQQGRKLWLFREHTEFGGKIAYTNDQKEVYRYLHIETLGKVIAKGVSENARGSFCLDYCAAMMLLGNDFLPHGLWFTIREGGGHAFLLESLQSVRTKHGPLVCKENLAWNKIPLMALIQLLAEREEVSLQHMISKKSRMHKRPLLEDSADWEKAMHEWMQTPVVDQDEQRLIQNTTDKSLSQDWRQVYYRDYLGASTVFDKQAVIRTYIEGLTWALEYVTSSTEVSWTWMFPWSFPPLWSDILKGCELYLGSKPALDGIVLQPQEQLALVLPLDSWHLVRDPFLRRLPTLQPAAFQYDVAFCTAGKRMMWECDPHVPLLTPQRLRFLQKMASEDTTRWDRLTPKDLTQRMSESIKTFSPCATLGSVPT